MPRRLRRRLACARCTAWARSTGAEDLAEGAGVSGELLLDAEDGRRGRGVRAAVPAPAPGAARSEADPRAAPAHVRRPVDHPRCLARPAAEEDAHPPWLLSEQPPTRRWSLALRRRSRGARRRETGAERAARRVAGPRPRPRPAARPPPRPAPA